VISLLIAVSQVVYLTIQLAHILTYAIVIKMLNACLGFAPPLTYSLHHVLYPSQMDNIQILAFVHSILNVNRDTVINHKIYAHLVVARLNLLALIVIIAVVNKAQTATQVYAGSIHANQLAYKINQLVHIWHYATVKVIVNALLSIVT
jgi:hypothetical protein